jgi:acyl-lipid omega-6 desaturase (Delta-12 desaturase)
MDIPMTTAAPVCPRSGAELIRATQVFETERKATTWYLLGETLAVLAGALFVVVHSPYWPVQVLAGAIAGLVQIRLFIFYHDSLHGAVFRRSLIANGIMSVFGFYLVAVRSVWKETHDFHHQNNAKLVGSAVGSYPILSVIMEERASPHELRMYNIARHPLTIIFGYFTVFMIGMAIAPFRRNAGRHWGGPVAIASHYALFAIMVYFFGWVTGACAVILPSAVSMAVGAYLFYAQHNFPAMKLSSRSDWSLTHAALRSSSMFDMSPMMHWFTGNIGFHHVHHLNHRIPFYRLRETMLAIPELQDPGRTSWRLRDIRACLRLYVWDSSLERMLTYADMHRGLPA